MTATRLLCALATTACCLAAHAYEGDVHYGLTAWLARQAGFDAPQSRWIATADARVDGGMLETMELGLDHACGAHGVEEARQAQRHHYPARVAVPADAAARSVEAGGPAALGLLDEVLQRARGKEGLMLIKLGEALHPLQDSFAHRGVPSGPSGRLGHCNPNLFAGHPLDRGGPDAHDADLTNLFPQDALAMARATYDALLRYPQAPGQPRRPVAWESMRADVETLLRASTKAAKARWFAAHDVEDTGFLLTLSLPDGPGFERKGSWQGVKLPTLPPGGSTQHEVDRGLRAFYDDTLSRWLGREGREGVATIAGLRDDKGRSTAAQQQLVARLVAWKVRDHGSVARLAHATTALTPRELQSLDRLARAPAGLVGADTVDETVYPLQPAGPDAAPLLPFVVRPWAGVPDRYIAILRLRHAPSDVVGLVAQRGDRGWVLVDLVSLVND